MCDAREFNLVDEPWIRVRYLSGEIKELSLLDVFRNAPIIAALVNDLPTQDFAIFRVLLAILQRSVMQGLNGDEDPAKEWGKLWNSEDLLFQETKSYLTKYRHRFNLLDDEKPFMQVAGMQKMDGKLSSINKIVFDLPSREPFFAMRFGKEAESLSYAEAARWLIHTHAFDVAGIKSGVIGDPDGKTGRNYPKGKGWAGSLGGVFIQGNTLRETLLLNLVMWESKANDDMLPPSDDRPAWEQTPKTIGSIARTPYGFADILTWESRRVLLHAEGGRISHVILTNANRLDPSNLQNVEAMTAWEKTRDKKKKPGGLPTYLPKMHKLEEAFWQSLPSILPTLDPKNGDSIPPGVIDWIAYLLRMHELPGHRPLHLHAVGVHYDDEHGASAIIEIIDDFLVTNTFLLSPEGSEANSLIRDVMEHTHAAVEHLGDFSKNLCKAAGCEEKRSSHEKAQSQRKAYYELSGYFRSWLADITEDTNLHKAEIEWGRQVRKILLRISNDFMRHTSPAVFLGRKIQNKIQDSWMTASKAEAIFRRKLFETLPIFDDEKEGE